MLLLIEPFANSKPCALRSFSHLPLELRMYYLVKSSQIFMYRQSVLLYIFCQVLLIVRNCCQYVIENDYISKSYPPLSYQYT
jgi:hypothetical protein